MKKTFLSILLSFSAFVTGAVNTEIFDDPDAARLFEREFEKLEKDYMKVMEKSVTKGDSISHNSDISKFLRSGWGRVIIYRIVGEYSEEGISYRKEGNLKSGETMNDTYFLKEQLARDLLRKKERDGIWSGISPQIINRKTERPGMLPGKIRILVKDYLFTWPDGTSMLVYLGAGVRVDDAGKAI